MPEVLIRHKGGPKDGTIEHFGDEVYDGSGSGPMAAMEKFVTDPGETEPRHRTRQDDLADLDPESYVILDPEIEALTNRLAGIDLAMGQLTEQRAEIIAALRERGVKP